MAVQAKRTHLDFVVTNYRSNEPTVELLTGSPWAPSGGKRVEYVEHNGDPREGPLVFTMRCYMSLQGEDSPKAGERADGAAQDGEQLVYRYDWSFGIALMKGYYWDWMNCFPAKGALAIHLLLQPDPQDPGPEPVPVGAFLSAMRPSRNTKGWAEQALPAVMKGLADMARIGAHTLPMLDYAASGLTLGSTVLESSTGDRKNWFLYQFLDEELKCPAVEFRIYKEVLMEYGSLLRGTVFLAFPRSVKPNGGKVRIQLRPQLHYCDGDELCFIVPTDQIEPENPIYIDVEPR